MVDGLKQGKQDKDRPFFVTVWAQTRVGIKRYLK